LGVGVSGEAEAAVHAARRLVSNLPAGHVVVKLDFSNAFSCVRRDLILDSIATNIPEIYRLVYFAFPCEPVLTFGSHEILSSEGAQQGDPLGSLEFCEATHPLLLKLHSSVKIGFIDIFISPVKADKLDDLTLSLTLSGDLHTVERDITTIMESSSETGLQLNVDKREIIMDDLTEINTLATLNDFIRVNKEDMTLLEAPVFKGKAQDNAIQDKIDDLTRAVERLKRLQAHDALVILKNSLAIPKLLYLLRTSQCSHNPLLRQLDDT